LRNGIRGGASYIVEINDGTQYRTYQYNNLKNQKHPEAERFYQIINTFRLVLEEALAMKIHFSTPSIIIVLVVSLLCVVHHFRNKHGMFNG
jgi:hypothetical protein